MEIPEDNRNVIEMIDELDELGAKLALKNIVLEGGMTELRAVKMAIVAMHEIFGTCKIGTPEEDE